MKTKGLQPNYWFSEADALVANTAYNDNINMLLKQHSVEISIFEIYTAKHQTSATTQDIAGS